MTSVATLDSIRCDSLTPGSVVDVETRSRSYHVEVAEKECRISGHPDYCPDPVPTHIQGSIANSGEMAPGVIKSGMRLVFTGTDDRVVTTSEITAIRISHN